MSLHLVESVPKIYIIFTGNVRLIIYSEESFISGVLTRDMDEQEILRRQLDKLDDEHRELDDMINKMLGEKVVNQLAIQRLKKRKLLLKDQIKKIESKLLPNIIA